MSSTFPYLSASDFAKACSAFVERQTAFSGLGLSATGWTLHPAMEQDASSYLSLRKRVPLDPSLTMPVAGQESENVPESETEDGVLTEDDEDPELLEVRKNTPTQGGSTSGEMDFNILYSPTWRLPVLYFTPLEPVAPEALYRVAEDGVRVSQGEHLLSGEAWWFVHPCRTADVMEEWRSELGGDAEAGWVDRYLGVWIGVFGREIGVV